MEQRVNVLDTPIKFAKGVGEVRAKLLEKELGIATFGDMLHHFPFRYIDRTKIYPISSLNESSASTYIQVRAKAVGKSYAGEGSKRRFCIYFNDGTGQIEAIWFRGIKWIEKRIEIGREYIVFGKPTFFRDNISIIHPELEEVEKWLSAPVRGGLQGIYSTTERLNDALGSKGIYRIISAIWTSCADSIAETIPEPIRKSVGIIGLKDALYNIHFPQNQDNLRKAQFRLKFEELFGIQLFIQSRRQARVSAQNGYLFPKVGTGFLTFYSALPYPLTGAQKRVIKEIRGDTVSGFQMNRLLQGDVGSGKTVVALASMILATDNGFQASIMAPTEILARQHFATITKMTEKLNLNVAILTGTTKERERKQILEQLASGQVNILIGTHALIEDRVVFHNLGLVVIDEQHRFGVEQRAKLWTKGVNPPHILVMTATPIPRTLAMTIYGDLDVSVIDELPPNRHPIKTYHYCEANRLKLFGFIRRQIAAGRQIYFVYPLIKESEKMDYLNLEEGFESITRDFPLPKYRVTACHGKQKPKDKEESMRQFKEGEADILVATSVIEVGVDVPNATVMVVESAERFGLAQLHQLRGRVGRGGEQSYCILMTADKMSADSTARINAMCETSDGFRLAELDLKLRGAGDINGTMQSGEGLDLHIADPTTDSQIVEIAVRTAQAVLAKDANLCLPETSGLAKLRSKYSAGHEIDFSMIS